MGPGTQIGVNASDVSRKVGGLQRKAIDGCDGTLLVQQPLAIQREQHLAEAGDGAKNTARHIGDIAAIEALARVGHGKRCLPLEALAQRGGERRRIGRRARLQGGKRTRRIVQRTRMSRLANVDRGQEGMRMAGLVVRLDLAGVGVVDRRGDPIEVAIEQVDMDAADQQPAAAIDPRSPAAKRRDFGPRATIVERRGNLAQGSDVDRPAAAIVQPDVVVRRRRRGAAGARAAERDRLDAWHRRQRPDQAAEQGFVVCIAHGFV